MPEKATPQSFMPSKPLKAQKCLLLVVDTPFKEVTICITQLTFGPSVEILSSVNLPIHLSLSSKSLFYIVLLYSRKDDIT